MFEAIPQISSYMQYVVPPLIGAFIGYLTNKIAIRMLFRPLRAQYVFGVKLPLTPGIIPSKRHQLARNIGEMVGSHLLTGDEISKALAKPSFQSQLGQLLRNRSGAILDQDLGCLAEVIPEKYNSYFDIAHRTIVYKIKETLHTQIATQQFEWLVKDMVSHSFDSLLARDVDSLTRREDRERVYKGMEKFIKQILMSKNMEQWLEDFLYSQLSEIINKKKSLQQILPDSIIQLVLDIVEAKTPDILIKIGSLVKDPDIQQKLVAAIKKGVDSFSSSLGPMGTMVQNYLNLETIENAVRKYLLENDEDIADWLNDKEVQQRVAAALLERVNYYLQTPIADFISSDMDIKTNDICKSASIQICIFLQAEGVAKTLAEMLSENIEIYIEGGSVEIRKVLLDLTGKDGESGVRNKAAQEIVNLIRSRNSKELINKTIDQLFLALLQKPVGKLSSILPAGVREAMLVSMQNFSSEMLATEVPGLFGSLDIKNIVTEKVDSLDLLRLEALLLSIMEEQFKYINLFGALLGFLIGGLNVLLLYFI